MSDANHSRAKDAVIFAAAFCFAFGLAVVQLGSVFFLPEAFGASATVVGAFVATWSIAYVVGCIGLRKWVDRYLARHVLICASTVCAVCTGGLCIAPTLPVAFAFHVLSGLAVGQFWPPVMGWLAHEREGEVLSRSMSRFNVAWSSGMIVGPFVAGWTSELGAAIPIIVAALSCFASGAVIWGASVVLAPVRNDRHRESHVAHAEGGMDFSTPLRYPAWIGLFSAYVVIGVLGAVFPLYAEAELGLGKSVIGGLLLVRNIAGTAGFVVLGRLTFWHFRRNQMIGGQALLACCLVLLMYATRVPVVGVLFVGVGVLASLSYCNSLFHGVSGSRRRAVRMAIHEAIIALGLSAGSACGGMIYEHVSMQAVYAGCAGVAGTCMALQLGVLLARRGTLERGVEPC